MTLTKPLLAAPNVRELSIRLDNAIYFKASELTAPLSNALVRLATFANPAFYKQQLYAKPVWKNGSMSNGKDLHRFITYAKAYPDWLSGSLEARWPRFAGFSTRAAFPSDSRRAQLARLSPSSFKEL